MALTMILSYPHNDFAHQYHWLVCYHNCLYLVSLYGLHKDSLWHIIQLLCPQNDIFQTHNVFCALMIISLYAHTATLCDLIGNLFDLHIGFLALIITYSPHNHCGTLIMTIQSSCNSVWCSQWHCDTQNIFVLRMTMYDLIWECMPS